jgi:HPt (histidine-containing phosphotransfer) domain-containing protein
MDKETIQKLTEAGIDYRLGLERFGGNAPLFETFLGRFLKDDRLEQLTKTINAGDIEDACRIAHSLKGVVGNLSMTKYYEVVSRLEELLKKGDIEGALDLRGQISAEQALVTNALQDL